MIGVILRLELRRSRPMVIGLGAILLLYGSFISAFYPVIRDNAKLIDEYMAVFPKGMLAAFGMEGTLSNHGVFFNTYIGGMLWPIVAAIAAAILGTRQVAADLDRGFIELPLATRIDRIRYLATGICGQVLVLVVLSVAVVTAMLVVGGIVGAGFDGIRFLMEVPLLFLFACALCGAATLLSVLTLSRQVSAGLVAGGLLVMYLLDAVSRLQPDLEWLGVPSAFRYLRSTSAIDEGILPLGPIALFMAIAVATWGSAIWRFRSRDLVA